MHNIDNNPIDTTDTDNDHLSQTNNNRLEMSVHVKYSKEKKDQIDRATCGNSKDEEEVFLLEPTDSSNTDTSEKSASTTTKDEENRQYPLLSVSSTSSESVCRICQLAGKETGEDIRTTECECRGNLSNVHQSCLRQWVYYKGSNRCEICSGHFRTISPPTTPGVLQTEALQNLAWQLERTRPFNRRKRAIMSAVIMFLVIVTCVTAILTVSADREFERLSTNPWVTQDQINNANIVFSICIAFAFFCATMTIGLIIIWFGMEMCFIMHRRGILRRAGSTLLRNETS